MNDRPLNSYYYTPHCSNYVVHWVSLCTPPIKRRKERDTSVCSLIPFFSLFPNLLSDLQLYGVCVSVGRGGTLPYPREGTAGFSFLSPVHTQAPLRLWSLSPGAQEFSDLRKARLGIKAGSCSPPPAGPGLGEREQSGPLLSPHPPYV